MEGQFYAFDWIPNVFGTNLFFIAFACVHSRMFYRVTVLEDSSLHVNTPRAMSLLKNV